MSLADNLLNLANDGGTIKFHHIGENQGVTVEAVGPEKAVMQHTSWPTNLSHASRVSVLEYELLSLINKVVSEVATQAREEDPQDA